LGRVKLLSRLMSPAGFGLVLVLFFLLPFLSVSCDVPGSGRTAADYTGAHLVGDATPEWVVPADLDELLSVPNESPVEDVPRVPAGVQVLAIVLVVLAVGGVVAGFLPNVRARLAGSAALAAATLAVAVVTLLVALSNLREALLPQARELADGDRTMSPEELVADVLHVEPGFWLVALALVMLLLGNAGALLSHRRAQLSETGSAG
jgi:hypothetical protein